MKSSAQSNVIEIASAVADVLRSRELADAQRHAREFAESERRSAREAEQARATAEQVARARREQLESRLAVVTEEQDRCHASCIRIEAELKSLPGALLAERRRQSVLLGELARLQRELSAN